MELNDIDLAPCKNCKERLTGERDKDCHTTCIKYQKVLQYIHKMALKDREQKILEHENLKSMYADNFEPRRRRR